MLLAVCILNWCCHFIKSRRRSDSDSSLCYESECSNCGDENCDAEGKCSKSTRNTRVSFSDVDGMTTDETDASISAPGSPRSTGNESSKSSNNSCRCKH